MKKRRGVMAAVLLLALCGGSGLAVAAGVPGGSGARAGQLRAMSQNLYVGADIFRIFDAQTPAQIPFVVAAILQTVFDTDFPSRAEALADQIGRHRPHLIGLQEVSLIRVQSPGDFLVGNPQPAETVLFDYLQILLDALAARGLDYRVAGGIENADIELPFFAGLSGGVPLFDDVRLTDRDVILARGDVATSGVVARNFAVNLSFNVAGVDIDFLRGFVAVDATVAGRSYRFANTHLEVASPVPQVQAAQMLELIVELAAETDPVVVAGDLNSRPEDAFPQPHPQALAAGYVDVWERRLGSFEPGATCCQSETLDNPVSTLDRRIDHLLVRNATGFPPFSDLGPVRAEVVGDEPGDLTAGGLWSSDHAGVVAVMVIPSPSVPQPAGP